MDDITEEDLLRLAHDMVAAGNLNLLYGIDPFVRAKSVFELALKQYAKQAQECRPERPVAQNCVHISSNQVQIPDFLRYKEM
jgi:hypothetical protein